MFSDPVSFHSASRQRKRLPGLGLAGVLACASVTGMLACSSEDDSPETEQTTADGAAAGSQVTADAGTSNPSASEANQLNTGAAATDDATSPGACALADRVGGFTVEHTASYSSVQGKVTNGIIPQNIPEPEMTSGDCVLVRARSLFCEPSCASDETCDVDGSCIPYPVGQDAGAATITGLLADVDLEPRAPAFAYSNSGTLPNPAFAEGDTIKLEVAGGTDVPAFTLSATGIAPLVVHQESLALTAGEAAELTWDPPASEESSVILATLNISLHGGNPVRIECETADTGSLEFSAELIDALLGFGYSGFPAVAITRQSASSTELDWGCVDFRVSSTIDRLPVEIPGLVSCSESSECPDGQTCQEDLTCG